jgi:hypothetical protein
VLQFGLIVTIIYTYYGVVFSLTRASFLQDSLPIPEMSGPLRDSLLNNKINIALYIYIYVELTHKWIVFALHKKSTVFNQWEMNQVKQDSDPT